MPHMRWYSCTTNRNQRQKRSAGFLAGPPFSLLREKRKALKGKWPKISKGASREKQDGCMGGSRIREWNWEGRHGWNATENPFNYKH